MSRRPDLALITTVQQRVGRRLLGQRSGRIGRSNTPEQPSRCASVRDCAEPGGVACGSLGVLKVDLKQHSRYGDCGNKDDKGHKPPSRGTCLLFVAMILKIGHRNPSFHVMEDYILSYICR